MLTLKLYKLTLNQKLVQLSLLTKNAVCPYTRGVSRNTRTDAAIPSVFD